jgi:prophage regulatory protein
MTDAILPATRKHKEPSTALALRQQEPDYARLVAVAPSSSCIYPINTNAPIHILRLPEVMKRVGICRASIYQHIAAGSFPKQISLGARSVGWLEHEIDAWLAAKIQVRGKGTKLLTDH